MRRTRGGPGTGDRGLATVWVAVTTATLCAVFAMVLALGQAVSARHRAGGAADLAALAAADRALRGVEVACGAASEVAEAQKAEIVRCGIQGEVADVTVRVRFGPYTPEIRSRAGPPAAPPPPQPPAPSAALSSAVGPVHTRGLIPRRFSPAGPPSPPPGGPLQVRGARS
ncbi:Rv3654c family TadE-like protein [Streptomyces sp. NPDC014623]|uniref:Rv3654c family TadE-like protein n=1 Tax=Streptomyces sp. NPDC014623 TaxID=3364875 RepID=UPI00370160E1